MCGRAYETYTEDELELRYHTEKRKRRPLDELKPNYNLAPTQISPVILMKNDAKEIGLFRWGLIPFWAKDPKDAAKYSLINAKSEDITEKRSYKAAFEKRRCIIPLSGFFEWKKEEAGPKRPFLIRLKDEPILSAAGVWEYWQSKTTQQEVYSFSIITTEANTAMKEIHDRMPVILSREDENFWLDPGNHDPEALKKLLRPCPSQWLDILEISTRINSPKNNDPSVLEPKT